MPLVPSVPAVVVSTLIRFSCCRPLPSPGGVVDDAEEGDARAAAFEKKEAIEEATVIQFLYYRTVGAEVAVGG